MRRFRAVAIAAVVLFAAAPARSDAPLPAALHVLGTVTNAANPVGNALIIALNLQDLQSVQTYTSTDGTFSLPTLRRGIYKIIAVKQGFVPAITTVIPTRASHRIALRLDEEKKAKRGSNQEIWELRGSLPPDVLRDLEAMLAPTELVSYEIPRFRGEMVSLTGVANQASNPAYAQTALGVQTRLGDSWQVGLRGNLQRFEDPTDNQRFGDALAESSVMSMELRSSNDQSYKLASTMSSWTYADSPDHGREADVRAHNFEWRNGPARVQVRYFAQDNLFRDTEGSNLIEVAGAVPVMQTRRSDLGVALRVKQETVRGEADIFRTADVAANGSLAVVPSFIVHYGVDSRIGMHGQEGAPRAGAEWKMTKHTSIIGSAMVKVFDRENDTTTFLALPSIVYWSEDGRALPRYTYTFGFVTGPDEANRFSAVATVSEVDQALRMIFADEQNQFWDGVEIEKGDLRRDVRIAYRKQFGSVMAVDVAATAGTASQQDAIAPREKIYLAGDLQSTFNPTRTTLAVSYRDVQQPRDEAGDYRSERINVRMAQSLYLPVDIKLLLGLELARAENSPYLLDTLTEEGKSRKYIGGLALNF
ncbi:MAG TPA: carboxypeptidase-like regulatory domain-containing protein [Thermoanaerobaculia bacterium]|nr:carboxypeptidase-like regulatory domain-containing protein [Thermoanaerobaculia bacterium]